MTEGKIDYAIKVGNLLDVEIDYTSVGSTVYKTSWENVLEALVKKGDATKHQIAKAVGILLDVEISISAEGTVTKDSWENVYFAIKNQY
jgi:hypothetical protein